MKLHLGVDDVPYTHEDDAAATPAQAKNKRRNAARAAFGAEEHHGTTGDVATILEDEYHIMELFVMEAGGVDAITEALEESAKAAIEDMFSNASKGINGPPRPDHLALTFEATQEIEKAFRIFIDQKKLDGIVPGVPTQASLDGVKHSLKHPYSKKNPARPSFKDTGLYVASFRAWAEE